MHSFGCCYFVSCTKNVPADHFNCQIGSVKVELGTGLSVGVLLVSSCKKEEEEGGGLFVPSSLS